MPRTYCTDTSYPLRHTSRRQTNCFVLFLLIQKKIFRPSRPEFFQKKKEERWSYQYSNQDRFISSDGLCIRPDNRPRYCSFPQTPSATAQPQPSPVARARNLLCNLLETMSRRLHAPTATISHLSTGTIFVEKIKCTTAI